MHDETLLSHIRELVPISTEEATLVKKYFIEKHLRKKEFLLKSGDASKHMRFISSGCLRVYFLDKEANERILQFGIKGWWVNDLYAYLTNKKATYFIQAVTKSTVLQIHQEKLNILFDKVPMIDRFFRIKTQHAYVALQERTINYLSESAVERYNRFVKQYREVEQSIPQYMLASYLGVTPEHLSTIRKNMHQ